MKKISILLMTIICSFVFVSVVNAAESDLDSVAAIISVIGGNDKEIIQIDSNNTYQYYYKYVKINDSSFTDYVKNKKVVDESTDGSNAYITAAKKVGDYEKSFLGLIPTVNNSSEVTDWKKANNNEIVLDNLDYVAGSHRGYVLAVAAVKNGDSNVYISRMILESKSKTTLGAITYDTADTSKSSKKVVTTKKVVTENKKVVNNVAKKTKENPNTGINDYVLYLAPVSIVLGSAILLRKSYA